MLTKFVDFHKYCETCVHSELDESEEPCNECLHYPAHSDETKKPLKYKVDIEKKENV